MKIPDEPKRILEINRVPMIDVIFSILAFFIVSTLVNVTIQANGKIALNQEEISLKNLALLN